jgi:hypothetical protein
MKLKLFDFGFMICMKKPELVIIDMYEMTEYRAGRYHVAILRIPATGKNSTPRILRVGY